jgi:hypothetical protein
MKKLILLAFFFFLFLLPFSIRATELGQPETKVLFQVNDQKVEETVKEPFVLKSITIDNVSSDKVYLRAEVLSIETGCGIVEQPSGYTGFPQSLDENRNLLTYVWVFQESTYMSQPFYEASQKLFTVPFVGNWPSSLVWEGYVTLPSFPATIEIGLTFDCRRGVVYWGGLDTLLLPNVTAKIDRTKTKTIDSLTVTRDMWENCSFPIFENFVVDSVGSSLQGKKIFYRYNFNIPGSPFDNCGWGEFIIHPDTFKSVGKCNTLPGYEGMKPGDDKINFQVWFENPQEGEPRKKVKILDSLDWTIKVQDWSANLTLNADKLTVHHDETSVFSGKYTFNSLPVTNKDLYLDISGPGGRTAIYTKTDANGEFKCNINWQRGGETQSPCKGGGALTVVPGEYTITVKPVLADPSKVSCRYAQVNVIVDLIEDVIFNPSPANPGQKVDVKVKLSAPREERVSIYLPAISPNELCSCQTQIVGNEAECSCSVVTPSTPDVYRYLIKVEKYNYSEWKDLTVTSKTPQKSNLNLQGGGWNLFSLPLNTTISADSLKSKCGVTRTIWRYDPTKNVYEKADVLKPGEGYWLKLDSSCSIPTEGYEIQISDFPGLKKGWNLVGSPNVAINFSSIAGNCIVKSGPWKFNLVIKKYEKSSVLEPGFGYWVKVENDCNLKK